MRANSGGRVGAANRGCITGNIPAYSRLELEDALVAGLGGDKVAKVD